MDGTSDTRADTDINPAEEAPTEEKKNSHVVENVERHKNRALRTHYTVRWSGFEPQSDTARSTDHIPHQLQEAYWLTTRKVAHKPKSIGRKIRPIGKKVPTSYTASESRTQREVKTAILHR